MFGSQGHELHHAGHAEHIRRAPIWRQGGEQMPLRRHRRRQRRQGGQRCGRWLGRFCSWRLGRALDVEFSQLADQAFQNGAGVG
jgi:hypothetical protein